MKTETQYVEPNGKQSKGLITKVIASLPLPTKDLTQLWIEIPELLTARLGTLCQWPLFIEVGDYHNTGDSVRAVLDHLHEDGLITFRRCINGSDSYIKPCMVLQIVHGYMSGSDRYAVEQACTGKNVVLTVTSGNTESLNELTNVQNLFVYTGSAFDTFELERFVRDVIFQIRTRLRIEPSTKHRQ